MKVPTTRYAQVEAIVRGEARVVQGSSEDALRRKIDGFFWPMFRWMEGIVDYVQANRAQASASADPMASTSSTTPASRCVCIGLSCVQGGGKTTTTNLIKEVLQQSGRRCAIVSLDDFYLTRAEQIELAHANASNPLLQHRGNPGTQDLSLLMQFIRECRLSHDSIAVPRYNKSLHDGRGDREAPSKWDYVQGPLDVLLIEGWCMGFRARSASSIAELNRHLVPVNDALRDFEALYDELDALVVMQVETPQWVYRWREEQEAHLRRAQRPGLTTEEVRDFVDRFMPAYDAYLSTLYAAPTPPPVASSSSSSPDHLASIPRLVLAIDAQRTPLESASPRAYNTPYEVMASLALP